MMRAWVLSVAFAGALAACSSTPDRETPFDILQNTVTGIVNPPDVVDARDILTPELIASSPTSALLAVPQQLDRGYTLIPVTVRGDVVRWDDAVGGALIRRNGVLVGTRGLGYDMLSAEVGDLTIALRSGGARDVVRVERRLGGDNRLQILNYICDVVPIGAQSLNVYGRIDETVLFEERCDGDGPSFTNRYWLRQDGLIVRSVERVSVEYGALELTLIAQ